MTRTWWTAIPDREMMVSQTGGQSRGYAGPEMVVDQVEAKVETTWASLVGGNAGEEQEPGTNAHRR